MAQTFPTIASVDFVKDSLDEILQRDETLRSAFSGTAFPTSPAPIVGQICYRTDLGQHYRCTEATGPVWEVIGTGEFLRLAGGILTGALNQAKGAAIASASTINLDTATGNMVHITGTTTINTMTLAAGYQRVLVFDAALTVNLSANLVGPPTGNTGSISIAAGDVMLVVGDGSSVTKIMGVFRQNGSPLNTLINAIVSSTANGLLEQTGTGTMARRAIGVATSTSIPTRADADARYAMLDGSNTFTGAPDYNGEGNFLRVASGTATNSGKVSWGTSSPGALAIGEIYLRHA